MLNIVSHIQNHFVTPLTSLVVLQPDQEHCKDYEEDNDESRSNDDYSSTKDPDNTSEDGTIPEIPGISEGSDVNLGTKLYV